MIAYSGRNKLVFDWTRLFRRIVQYTWLIVLATVFWGTLMFQIGERVTPPFYVASTRIVVLREVWNEKLDSYDLSVSKYMRYDYSEMIYSRKVIEAAIEKLGLDTTYEKVRNRVFASGKPDSRILDIIVLDRNPDKAKQLANTIREETYLFMKEDLKMVDVTMNVIDEGYVWEERYSFNVKYWLIPSASLAFLITTAVIIIVYLLEDTVSETTDIEKRLKLGVLGSVPKKTQINKQEVVESYNRIRTNVEFTGANTIAITSTIPNEGKSSIAFELAEAFAQTEKKVLLIDADLRKSILTGRHSKGRVKLGLTHYLTGMHSFEEVCSKTDKENLQVVYAGLVPPNPCELLNGKKFEKLLYSAREQYDMVIVDTPPIGSVIDAAVVAAKCDGAIYVIAAQEVNLGFVQKVKQQLEATGKPILGCILNKAQEKKVQCKKQKEDRELVEEEFEVLFSNTGLSA
ncbi:MAG: polysaccharide biosynthesis tyrosine autokinase [Lachnospiraceae bacterium]|nr:polysaccharide biosynthesis tyrosine autokinase [Lachnospiraceae bacterium]